MSTVGKAYLAPKLDSIPSIPCGSPEHCEELLADAELGVIPEHCLVGPKKVFNHKPSVTSSTHSSSDERPSRSSRCCSPDYVEVLFYKPMGKLESSDSSIFRTMVKTV